MDRGSGWAQNDKVLYTASDLPVRDPRPSGRLAFLFLVYAPRLHITASPVLPDLEQVVICIRRLDRCRVLLPSATAVAKASRPRGFRSCPWEGWSDDHRAGGARARSYANAASDERAAKPRCNITRKENNCRSACRCQMHGAYVRCLPQEAGRGKEKSMSAASLKNSPRGPL